MRIKEVKFGTEPVDGRVYVIGKPWIKTLFESFVPYKYPVERGKVEEAIASVMSLR